MTLVYTAVAWMIGIWLASLFPAVSRSQSDSFALLLMVAGIILMINLRANLRLIGFYLIFLAFGLLRYNAVQITPTPEHLIFYNDKGYAEIVGVVADDPQVRDNAIRLRVEVESIRQGYENTRTINGLMLVNADRLENYGYGQRLKIEGFPQTPPDFDDFSYREYLSRSGVYTLMLNPQITLLEVDQGSPFWKTVFALKDRSRQIIAQLLPSPISALLTGILLGDENGIPPDVQEAFTVTGTAHLLAISGANIAVITGLLMIVFSRIQNKWMASFLTIVTIALYTLLVGASASVVRAAIMASMAIIAERVGRKNDGVTALAFSIFLMTLLNPMTLFDAGLILSAAATLGLILYAQPRPHTIDKLVLRVFPQKNIVQQFALLIGESAWVIIVAQIFTTPIILAFFGRLSLASFPVNLIVEPAQAPIMILGILTVLGGLIWQPVGQLFAWLAGIPLSFTLWVIRAASQSPIASFPLEIPSQGVIIYYGILLGATILIAQPAEKRQDTLAKLRSVFSTGLMTFLGGSVAFLLLAAGIAARTDGKLHVNFLAVGEGNAVLITTPQGAHILIDGGENPTQLAAALGDHLPYYKRALDLLIITQPKRVTVAALPTLFERYTVKNVITNGHQPGDEVSTVLQNAVQKAGAQITAVQKGYRLETGDNVLIEVLNPSQSPTEKNKVDDVSLVIRLRYGNAAFILNSELSEAGIQNLIDSDISLDTAVVQIPSNGQDRENIQNLLDKTSPQIAVIVAEAGNRAAQPHFRTLDALGTTTIYRSDLHGKIEITTDGQQLMITTAKPVIP